MKVAFSCSMSYLVKKNIYNKWARISAAVLFYATQKIYTHANGIDGNGTGAAAMAMGGADVGWAQGPLESMGDNPAGLGFLTGKELDFGAVGGNANGQFSKQNTDSKGNLSGTPRGLPEGAFGMQLGQTPIYAGLSLVPESVLLADWGYLDPGTVSYGNQTDKSEILVLRSALGLSVKLS